MTPRIPPSIFAARKRAAIRHAIYELHRRGDRTLGPNDFRSAPGTCRCGASNEVGLWVSQGTDVCCPSCAPTAKVCQRCLLGKPIGEFRVNPNRLIIDVYCRSCEQARNREHYHRSKGKVRQIPKEKHCPNCRQTKRAADFQLDGRYQDGLSSWCLECIGQHR